MNQHDYAIRMCLASDWHTGGQPGYHHDVKRFGPCRQCLHYANLAYELAFEDHAAPQNASSTTGLCGECASVTNAPAYRTCAACRDESQVGPMPDISREHAQRIASRPPPAPIRVLADGEAIW